MTKYVKSHKEPAADWQEKRADQVMASGAGAGAAKSQDWNWVDYICPQDGSLRVSLAASGVRDADLEMLTVHLLRSWEEDYAGRFPHGCDLTMDLSCNCGISDYGIIVHLVPFLRRWPTCRRLKLYQTSIGDRALEALIPWISRGYVHELHLSDLNGDVTPGMVLTLLRAIHFGGRYPYWKLNGGRAPLWLRLEHNRIPHVDELVVQARAEGFALRVLARSELSTVRPGDDLRRKGQDNPEVILVLFRLQQRKELVQDERIELSRDLLSMLGKDTAGSSAAASAGRYCARPRAEPQPLSVDEFRLWEMQAREDEEGGADERNLETFGEDDGQGWTFEENLAANAWIARRTSREWQWQQQPRGWSYSDPGPPPPASPEAAREKRPVGHGGQRQRSWTDGADKTRGGGAVEVDAGSTTSSAPSNKNHVAKLEVEEAIANALGLIPTLQKLDFDGQVRQYLHAIRNKGGQQCVLEATQVIRIAMVGKTRTSVDRWPAYLVALLKRFLAELKARAADEAFSEEAANLVDRATEPQAALDADAHALSVEIAGQYGLVLQ